MPPADNHIQDAYTGSDQEASLETLSSVQAGQVLDPPKQPGKRVPLLRYNKVAFKVTGVGLGLIILIVLGGLFLMGNRGKQAKQETGPKSANYGVESLPVQGLEASQQLKISDADHLAVNGELRVNGSLALAPSGAPSNPTAGQIYYDKSTNAPYYYNGTRFISLQPAPAPAPVAVTPSQVVNPGVLSIQGQRGAIRFVAGDGIAVDGLTIRNTGVINLPQALGGAAAPTFDGLKLTGLSQNGVLYGGGSGLIGSAATNTAGLCLLSTAGAPVWDFCSAGSGGVNTVGALDSQPKSADGAVIFGSSLVLQTADATSVGLVSTGAQTLAGAKTLTGPLTVSNSTDINTASAAAFRVRDGGATTFVIDSITTRVGIGNPAPAYRLDVNGDINSATALRVGGNIVCTSAGCNTVAGSGNYIQNGTAPQTADFNITGNATIGSTLNIGADTNLYRSAANVLKTDDGLIVGTLATTGTTALCATATNQLSACSGGGSGNFIVNGTSLQTSANFNIQSAAAANVGGIIRGAASQTADLFQLQSSAGTVLARFDAGGNLGIGTTGPGYKLDVQGGTGIVALFSGRVIGGDAVNANEFLTKAQFDAVTGGSAGAFLQNGNNFGSLATLGTNDNFGLALETNGIARFSLDTSGNANLTGALTVGALANTGSTALCVTLTNLLSTCSGGGVGAGGANTALSNLQNVAINTSLLSGSATIDLGSNTNPFRDLFLGGTATNNFRFTGTATAARTITVPDASGTLCLSIGNCSGSGSANTLQAAYDAGNTIITTDARDIGFTLANTATDSNLLVNIATGSTGRFAVQNGGSDVLAIGSAGQLALSTQGSSGGLVLGADTNLYRSAADTLKTDDALVITGNLTNNGSALFKNASNSIAAFQIQNSAGTSNLFSADTANTRIGIGTATPAYTLDVAGDINTTGLYRINGVQVASGNLSDASNIAYLNGSGPQTFTGNNKFSGAFLAQNAADSTTAFQIQNSAGSSLFTADTTNGRLAFGPAAAVANGVLTVGTNTTVAGGGIYFGTDTNLYRSATDTLKTDDGLIVGTLASTGTTVLCITASNQLSTCNTGGGGGSSGFIANSTSLQTGANFNIQSAAAANVGGAIRGAAAQTADLFQLQDSAGTTLAGFNSSGQLYYGNSGFTGLLNSATLTADQTYTLPDASGTFCLDSGNCSGAGSTNTLQAAYEAGNTITTADARDISFTLADTATDSNLLVNIATGSTGRFAVQNGGSDVLAIGSAGQLALSAQGSAGGLLLGGDTNLYRSAADTLKTDDALIVTGALIGNGAALFKNASNSTTAFQIQNSGGTTVFNADTTNGRVGINTTAPGNLLSIGALTTASASAQIAVSTNGTTNSGIVVQTVAGQTTGNILQAQDSTGATLASIDYQGNLTVKAATINGNLTLNGHLVTAGTTPTAATGVAAGGGSVTVNGNDTFGTVTITTGASPASQGVLATVSFSQAFGAAPKVILSPSNAASSGSQFYKGNVTTSSFQISVNAIPYGATVYTFDYFVGQ